MTSVVITDDQGQILVSVDRGDPQPVESVEEVCSIVEQAFGQPDQDDESVSPEEMTTEGNEDAGSDQFASGFGGVRGKGLNG